MPYAIIRLADARVVARFGSVPASFDIDGHRIVAPVAVGDEGLGYRFIQVVEVGFDQPGLYYTAAPTVEAFDGDKTLTITRSWTAWTQAEIDTYIADRRAAIAAQFDNTEDLIRASSMILGKAIRDMLNAIAAASSLADLKTRMAVVASATPQTPAEFKSAIIARLGT